MRPDRSSTTHFGLPRVISFSCINFFLKKHCFSYFLSPPFQAIEEVRKIQPKRTLFTGKFWLSFLLCSIWLRYTKKHTRNYMLYWKKSSSSLYALIFPWKEVSEYNLLILLFGNWKVWCIWWIMKKWIAIWENSQSLRVLICNWAMMGCVYH